MITVYTGTMYGGKSEKLIKTYLSIEDENKICFKPSKDKRDKTFIRSRALKEQIPATVISNFEEILFNIKPETKYIFIDEIQFLKGNWEILQSLSINNKINIYVSGLKETSEFKPFGEMPDILAIADNIEILNGKCSKCGKEARYTIAVVDKKEDVLIGDKNYDILCEECVNNDNN